jgi:hypothetical protein
VRLVTSRLAARFVLLLTVTHTLSASCSTRLDCCCRKPSRSTHTSTLRGQSRVDVSYRPGTATDLSPSLDPRSSASAVSTLVQTYSSFSPSVLISPYLDVPVHFALSTIESDIEGMASPAQGLAGLGQGIMKGQRLEESRALRDWLREAGSIWGF